MDGFFMECPLWTVVDSIGYETKGLGAICILHNPQKIWSAIFTDDDLADRFSSSISTSQHKSSPAVIDTGHMMLEVLKDVLAKGVTHVIIDPKPGAILARRVYGINEIIGEFERAIKD